MRKVFAALATLLLLLVVAEFYFAASGAFDGKSSRPHHVLGYVIFLLPIVMAIVGALARMPGRLIGLTVAIAGLTGIQVLIAKISEAIGHGTTAGQLVFGLHAVNGLLLLAVTGLVFQRSWALARSHGSQAGPATATVTRPDHPDR